jgi:cellulose synthase/poly-beta-1,6-N-acetylglucosamine synthase-like glycosyltransferase
MRIRIVDNPKRIIPAALNQAIQASEGEVVVRLDAHSAPFPDYIERCLEFLEDKGAANVGGVWLIQPGEPTIQARGIASAASHPLGAGGARYRTSGKAGPVETVPFGCFPREWLQRIGPFNEELLTNEDYEYNSRIRKAGGLIWFDPRIRSTYYARSNYNALANQYLRYGYWKAKMLLLHPDTLRWRQLLPPLFVLMTLLFAPLSIFWSPARWLLGVQLIAYLSITILAGFIDAVQEREIGIALGFPPAIWIMHYSWGGAFLWSLLTGLLKSRRPNDET